MPTIILNSTNKCLSNSTKSCDSKVIAFLGKTKTKDIRSVMNMWKLGMCWAIQNPYKKSVILCIKSLFFFIFILSTLIVDYTVTFTLPSPFFPWIKPNTFSSLRHIINHVGNFDFFQNLILVVALAFSIF
jgi:hypothetical protein